MVKLFMVVLNMSIGASVCILAVMLLRLLLKHAPRIFSYLLWTVVLVRLVCPVLPEAKFGLLPEMDLVEEIVPISKEAAYANFLLIQAGKWVFAAGSQLAGGSEAEMSPYMPEESGEKPAVVEADLDGALIRSEDFILDGSLIRLPSRTLLVLATVWALVAIGLCIYAIAGYVLFMRRVDKGKVTTPFVAGLLRPRVYLPDGLSNEQKQLVQEHEQIHISRLDYLVKPIVFLVCCIHWFNPLVWAAFFLMERDMEASCDEAVIRKIGYDRRKDYANTLLGLSQSRGWKAGYPIAFGENHVKSRIKGVVKMKKAGIGMIAGAVLVVVVAVVLLLVDQPQEETVQVEEENSDMQTEELPAEDTVSGVETSLEDAQSEMENLPDGQVGSFELEPETERAEGFLLIPDEGVQEYIYLPREDNQVSDGTAEAGGQETIMNYVPDRARDQYEIIHLPQPDETFDSIGILFSYPVEGGRISDGFGSRIHPVSGDVRQHLGIDFAADEGTPIVAAADGTVVKTGFDDDNGNYVVLLHGNGEASYYCHCKEIVAREEDQVKRGEQIATVGKTGRTTGALVHFAVSRNGEYVEPEFMEVKIAWQMSDEKS